LGVAAQSVGIAEAAYREALKYAREREQFGKSIIHFPAVYEMLGNMRAKIDAVRTLLYETSRFVDVSKLYEQLSKERPLTAEERTEMKHYQKLTDIYTPMLKLMSSEYCNQIAYDALQVHGGTGYMQDFPVARLYRDARITSIYEGTSQLQVVAAIKGIGNGLFLKQIKEYENVTIDNNLNTLKIQLQEMTNRFEKMCETAKGYNNTEMYDFAARRLVEAAANIICGYLLLADATRCADYATSAHVFINLANAQNFEKEAFVNSFSAEINERYK
jgi:hypothetical protein